MLLTPVFAGSPSTPTKDSKAELAGDFDRFLRLLTTQLQNQDPLSPMDSTEFTNQLVQFSQVEQSIKTNDQLEAMIAAQEFATSTAVGNLAGKRVDVLTQQIAGGEPVDLFYALPEDASSLSIRVIDATGNTVRSFTGTGAAGLHRIEWDGRDGDGDPIDPGTPLAFVVEAENGDGAAMTAQVGRTGRVEDIRQTEDGLVAHVAGRDVPVSQIISVRAG